MSRLCTLRGCICTALFFLAGIGLLLVLYLAWRFSGDSPVEYRDPVQHFQYGSLGGERVSGFPYRIWKALPEVCPDLLPGKGYSSLGMIYEKGRDLPIGTSQRRYQGMNRVFLNCAVCHVNTVRDTPASTPRIVAGMPANSFDLMRFEKFFFQCAADKRFSREYMIPAIEKTGGKLDLIDHYLVYPLATLLMREQLMMLRERFSFIDGQPEWGPGRVDTFNSAKALFNMPWHRADPHELIGTADFPAIWNQAKKRGMQLHWDGNNNKLEERNHSAALGAGTTPPTLDRHNLKRVEAWLATAIPPPWPYPIDQNRAARGKGVYQQYCAACHGVNGSDFSGEYVGKVTPILDIGTDRWRLDSYTPDLALNQATVYAGYGDERFSHFRKTWGYANAPLDGLWLRAPYLHNGSVPTLADLLEPADRRPKIFYRGYDVYDAVRMGFVSTVAEEGARKYFRYDTRLSGNGNQGHDGPRFGTTLPPEDKAALIEYMKTF
jgi:hypothetical protein